MLAVKNMKLGLTLVPFTILCFFAFNAICDENQELIRDQVLKWWKDISVQKPLKCKLNPTFLDPKYEKSEIISKYFFRDDQRINLIQSRPCKEDEVMDYDFTGKGKIIDGKLEGPGKLIIRKQGNFQG